MINRVLNMSYNALPYEMKSCFLYLSIYPEDYEISRGDIVRRWMAEGFISKERGSSLQEIAEGYFDQLVSRSIVEPVRIDNTNCKAKSCKVHDIMLEVILGKSIQQNFVSILRNDESMTSHNKIRRLSVQGHGGILEDIFSKRKLSNIRTLSIIADERKKVRSCHIKDHHKESKLDWSSLKFLRVLDIEGDWIVLNDNILKGICKLFRLKYLSLRKTNISNLPDEIGDLHGLETLDIRQTRVSRLPGKISSLTKLKYLLMGRKYHHSVSSAIKFTLSINCVEVPIEVGKMESLLTLSLVDATRNYVVLKTLGELTAITKLCIRIGDNEHSWDLFAESLSNIAHSLLCLAIYHEGDARIGEKLSKLRSPPRHLRKFILQGPMHGVVPLWFCDLLFLSKMVLMGIDLTEKLFCYLGRLPSLLSLELIGCWPDQPKLTFTSESGFQVLKMLIVTSYSLPNKISEISFGEGSTPCLERIMVLSPPHPNHTAISGIPNLHVKELIDRDAPKSMMNPTAPLDDHGRHCHFWHSCLPH